MHVSWRGVTMAVLSGAVASGLGYALWYAVLAGMAATRAATAQLSVPVIAALGGVVLLAEPVTVRLLVSSVATLGGIALVLMQRGSNDPAG
jgi:drug/metabolite transporter (DMT)-like permease